VNAAFEFLAPLVTSEAEKNNREAKTIWLMPFIKIVLSGYRFELFRPIYKYPIAETIEKMESPFVIFAAIFIVLTFNAYSS
jgi:hypothetical protein